MLFLFVLSILFFSFKKNNPWTPRKEQNHEGQIQTKKNFNFFFYPFLPDGYSASFILCNLKSKKEKNTKKKFYKRLKTIKKKWWSFFKFSKSLSSAADNSKSFSVLLFDSEISRIIYLFINFRSTKPSRTQSTVVISFSFFYTSSFLFSAFIFFLLFIFFFYLLFHFL